MIPWTWFRINSRNHTVSYLPTTTGTMLLSKRKRASRAPFRLSIVALPADALNSHTDTASSWKQRRYRMRYGDTRTTTSTATKTTTMAAVLWGRGVPHSTCHTAPSNTGVVPSRIIWTILFVSRTPGNFLPPAHNVYPSPPPLEAYWRVPGGRITAIRFACIPRETCEKSLVTFHYLGRTERIEKPLVKERGRKKEGRKEGKKEEKGEDEGREEVVGGYANGKLAGNSAWRRRRWGWFPSSPFSSSFLSTATLGCCLPPPSPAQGRVVLLWSPLKHFCYPPPRPLLASAVAGPPVTGNCALLATN